MLPKRSFFIIINFGFMKMDGKKAPQETIDTTSVLEEDKH